MNVNDKIFIAGHRGLVFFRKLSYAQCGEDLILENLLRGLVKNEVINYCDIGANSPWKLSNTEKFKPMCIVIETVDFVKSGMTTKARRIIDKLEENGYFEYAFTGINSIFIEKEKRA